jgi:hypothetical protein
VNAREKLTLQKELLEPMAQGWLKEMASGGGYAIGMAVSMMTPMVEAWVDEFLARPADVIDLELAGLIDFLGRLRSDDARAIVAGPDGARWVDPAAYELAPAGDWLRPPDLRDRPVGNGQVHAGPEDLPLG